MIADEAATKRSIGEVTVSAIGLGGASWSLLDSPGWPDDAKAGRSDEEGIETIHAAIDAGVTLIDTARVYTTATHPGHSEALIRRALASHPRGSSIVVATKGGQYRSGNNFPVCGSPEALKSDCEASRALLGRDRIDLYQLHWPDPAIGIEASIEALAQLRDAGWIREIGVSNVSVAQLEEAVSIAPIASVQNHFSPLDQSDRSMVDYCAEQSIAYMAYSPLGGRANGVGRSALADTFPAAVRMAERRGVSLQRLALAWLISLSPTLIPICGASRPASIRDSLLAAELELSDEEWAELDFESAVAGPA
jgi:aryl-alcohol dehydrogenase-like predicted oxidoreductase